MVLQSNPDGTVLETVVEIDTDGRPFPVLARLAQRFDAPATTRDARALVLEVRTDFARQVIVISAAVPEGRTAEDVRAEISAWINPKTVPCRPGCPYAAAGVSQMQHTHWNTGNVWATGPAAAAMFTKEAA